MSKTWYPMINYEKCTECGACVEFCGHGVYDDEKAQRPVVAYPEGCITGCRGCGGICPGEAISYFGDTGKTENSACCDDCDCSSGCGDKNSDCGCGDENSDCGNQSTKKDSKCGCGCK